MSVSRYFFEIISVSWTGIQNNNVYLFFHYIKLWLQTYSDSKIHLGNVYYNKYGIQTFRMAFLEVVKKPLDSLVGRSYKYIFQKRQRCFFTEVFCKIHICIFQPLFPQRNRRPSHWFSPSWKLNNSTNPKFWMHWAIVGG
mgnify:CR=1 FL=1